MKTKFKPIGAEYGYKEIVYSFPSSPNAEELGFGKTGCWRISLTAINIEGSGQCRTYMPHNAEGYRSKYDPDLIAQFNEIE